MDGRSLLIVYVFTSPDCPRGPPWNKGHRPKVRHETCVLEVPAQEQHEHSFCSSTTNVFISYSLYMIRRYRTSPGTPDLRARLGWLQGQYNEWNVVGVHTLYWRSLSVGAAAWSAPYCQYRKVCSPTRPNANQANKLSTTTDPRFCARGGIYSWWHSASSANGSGSHDGAPVTGAYGHVMSCNGVAQCWFSTTRTTVVPGWSPYMVPETGFRPAQWHVAYQ